MTIQELVFAIYLMNFSPIAWRYGLNRLRYSLLGFSLIALNALERS